jgi:hypothetical protein
MCHHDSDLPRKVIRYHRTYTTATTQQLQCSAPEGYRVVSAGIQRDGGTTGDVVFKGDWPYPSGNNGYVDAWLFEVTTTTSNVSVQAWLLCEPSYAVDQISDVDLNPA